MNKLLERFHIEGDESSDGGLKCFFLHAVKIYVQMHAVYKRAYSTFQIWIWRPIAARMDAETVFVPKL